MARSVYCQRRHKIPTTCRCSGLINVARKIVEFGVVKLKDAYCCVTQHMQPCESCVQEGEVKCNSPTLIPACDTFPTYKASHAKRLLLQMPINAITVNGSHQQSIYLCSATANITMLKALLERSGKQNSTHVNALSKEEFKELIAMCDSDKMRNCLRYAVGQATGALAKTMRLKYGVENYNAKSKTVKDAIAHVHEIRQGIEHIANIKEKATLMSLGLSSFEYSDSDSSEGSESDTGNDVLDGNDESSTQATEIEQATRVNIEQQLFRELLVKSQFNWFALSEILKADVSGVDENNLNTILLDLPQRIESLEVNERELYLITQSKDAYDEQDKVNQEAMDIAEGIIQSDDDECAQPVNWNNIKDPLGGEGKELLLKKIISIRRKKRRDIKKKVEMERILKRRRSKNIGKILRECPNIGKEIEKFVEESGVGADAWRRTGVLTFDGNRKVNKKVTFNRIKEHVEVKYGRKFSYGSIVQLCVARNAQRRNARNYKGIAKITCRRSRKGFDLKFNPDSHWSSALYRGLDHIQYTTTADKVILNRDDLSVFRLDSMASSNKCASVCIKGKVPLSTKADYQQKYPCTLQTASYNFSASHDEGEMCAGVVKGAAIHNKNPAQHAADLEMLEVQDKFQVKFTNRVTGLPKEVECIRVDSGNDEAPWFEEVQFWWTKRHLERPTRVQLVTSRHSGGSNLNRVELQNGCEVKARTNLFIPSTLNGLNCDQTGKNNERLKKNISDAIEVYISRVDQAPCGDTIINLFKGADSHSHQSLGGQVRNFLSGSKQERANLAQEHPEEYKQIQIIWDIRKAHLNNSVPTRYIFHLVCCYQKGCPHPICQAGKPQHNICWHEGGPTIDTIPLPIPDPDRPFGSINCASCYGVCSGHYLPPENLMKFVKENKQGTDIIPPSEVLKEFKKRGEKVFEENSCQELARIVLLKPSEVLYWLEHLRTVQENRKEGARKAAETRRQKRNASSKAKDNARAVHVCAKCQQESNQESATDISWISCDECKKWFHQRCVSIERTDIEGTWCCNGCLEKSICQACYQADPLEATDEEDISWVGCDNCQNWYHLSCVGQVDVSKEWLCSTCK